MAAATFLAPLALAPGRLAPLGAKLDSLGINSPLIAREFFQGDPEAVVQDILELGSGLEQEEKDFFTGYLEYLEKAARFARKIRNGETYADDVTFFYKKARLEPDAAASTSRRIPGTGCWRPSRFKGPGDASAGEADAKAMARWRSRLGTLLVAAGAPSVEGASNLDDRVAIICGKSRAGTLRLRVRAWEEFIRWLRTAKLRSWPDEDADVVDYARWLVEVGAPKSRLSHFVATFHWILPRSGFEASRDMKDAEMIKQTFGWAEVQLDDAKVSVRKAPRLLVGVLVAMEVYVVNEEHPKALRVASWMRLIKVYGALRWDDFKRIRPEDLVLRDSGLVGRLSRTKTTGVGKKVRELPLFIPRDASISGNEWLKEGFNLFVSDGDRKRDFMILRPREDLDGFGNRMATDSDVGMLCGALMTDLRKPVKVKAAAEGMTVWMDTADHLMQPIVARGWTNHSERATLSSMLAAVGVDKARRDVLGRWSPSGSDDYVRTYKAIVKDLINRFCRTVSSGRAFEAFDEEDAVADVGRRIASLAVGDEAQVEEATREFELNVKEIALGCAAQAPEEAPTEVASLSPASDLPGDAGEADEAMYIVVYTRGRAEARLHRMDGCWRARKMDFKRYELIDIDPPPKEAYNAVCKVCWPQAPTEPSGTAKESDDSESDSGSSESDS